MMAAGGFLDRVWRLGPLLAGATAVLLLVTGVLIVYSGEESYRREKIDEVEVEARILASTVIAALTFDDRNAAQTYVGRSTSTPRSRRPRSMTRMGSLSQSIVAPRR
jgi:hypothetical protein